MAPKKKNGKKVSTRKSRRLQGKSPLRKVKACPKKRRVVKVQKKNKGNQAGGRKRRCNKKGKRRTGTCNYWTEFFKHVARRVRDNKLGFTPTQTMERAGACWRLLTAEQKAAFKNRVDACNGRRSANHQPCRPPSPPPGTSSVVAPPSSPGADGRLYADWIGLNRISAAASQRPVEKWQPRGQLWDNNFKKDEK